MGSDYTFFVVKLRSSNKTSQYFLAGSESLANSNLHLGYRNDPLTTQAHFPDDVDKN